MVVQLLLQIVAILFYITYASGCDNTVGCVILENPKTSVIKYDDTVVVTCGIRDDIDTFSPTLMIFDIDDTTITNFQTSMLQDRGITNVNCDQTTKLCTATVLGNDMNNGLEINCLVGGCCTESAFIYVADGIPDPPDAPVVTFINTMSLNISWSSPWDSSVIPVNNYTLIITDNNTGIHDTVITTLTYYIFAKQENVSCEDVYLVTVSADTDLGETNKSDSSSASFLSDIDDLVPDGYMFIQNITRYECGVVALSPPSYMVNGHDLNSVCSFEDSVNQIYYLVDQSNHHNDQSSSSIFTPDVMKPLFYFQSECRNRSCDDWNIDIRNNFNETRKITESIDFAKIVSQEVIVVNGIVDPVTTVAFPNTAVTFTCSKENENPKSKAVIIDGSIVSDNNINSTSEWIDIQTTEGGYTVTITAYEDNNNTRVQCFISPCFTNEATLIIVDTPPDPVDTPVTIINNDTSILITWSPPWVHPVNMYYVIVTDITKERNVLIGNYSVKDTHYYLTSTSGFECSILSVTVQAVTDVDTTDPSNATTIPVYTGLTLDIEVINSSKKYTVIEQTEQTSLPSLHISFEPPPVCDHEVLTYQFKLKDLLPPFTEVLRNSGRNSSAVIELSSYLFHDDVLMVSVEVNVSNGYTSITIPLYDRIAIDSSEETSTSSSSDNLQTSEIIGIVFGCIAVVIVFVSLLIIMIVYFSVKNGKGKSITMSSTDMSSGLPMKKDQAELVAMS